jgi:hypothetical protein
MASPASNIFEQHSRFFHQTRIFLFFSFDEGLMFKASFAV